MSRSLICTLFVILSCSCSPDGRAGKTAPDNSRTEPIDQISGGDSIFAGPEEEHLKKEFTLARELGRTLEELDGVSSVRVHLSLVDTSFLSKKPTGENTAAVLVRHVGAFRENKQTIQNFVSNAVKGLEPGDVEVLFSANPLEPVEALVFLGPIRVSQSSVLAAKLCIGGLLVLCFLLAVALILAGLKLRRIHRG